MDNPHAALKNSEYKNIKQTENYTLSISVKYITILKSPFVALAETWHPLNHKLFW